MAAGAHTIKVVVDPNNNIAETNESNNTYTKTFYVTGANTVPAPTFSLSNTSSEKLTLTAKFDSSVAKKQYSTDKKTWKTYTSAITVTANGTYYFRAGDNSGNFSEVTSVTITSIKLSAAPTVKASTTKATNKNITLTATFAKDSVKKQYSTDKKTWKTYSKALSISKNGTYYFRSVNKSGKASEVATFKVKNIDKVAPKTPVLELCTTKKTNQNVTIYADFADDSAKTQYSTNNKTWKNCSCSLTVGKNGTYYFRSIDAAGNISKVKSIKVTNIDKTPPAAPTVKASNTKLTNKNITLTATFSKDSAKKQYSTDNKTWKTYSKALSVGKNGTYYFRGIDAAGNKSKVKSIKVTNIDKTMNTGNNTWSNATEVLGDDIRAAVNNSFDKVDYYDLRAVEDLCILMERGKIKASFYNSSKKSVKCTNGLDVRASSFIVDANNPDKESVGFLSIPEEARYLKIEAEASGTNRYYLYSTLA